MASDITLISHFDINYAARAVAMMNSAERNTTKSIFWKILALDTQTYDLLRNLNPSNVELFTTDQVGTDLLSIRDTRTYKEYCWSAGAIFMDFILKNNLETDLIGYIDADCYFFSDVSRCFSSLGTSKNIAAHGHNFPEELKHWEKTVGKFNVGLVLGRKSSELSSCIEAWKNQVILSCTTDVTSGNFGDQKYLDSWPELYKGFLELTSPGVGVAPWNIDNLNLEVTPDGLKVNGVDLVFYHFHGLHQIINLKYFSIFQAARGYTINKRVRKNIYIPYFRDLSALSSGLDVPIVPKSKSILTKRDISRLLFLNSFKIEKKMYSIF